ncbi:hypothetical protein Nmel_010022, partial [Mimus melanotis]
MAEEAAVSEAAFSLQSILLPPRSFPLHARPSAPLLVPLPPQGSPVPSALLPPQPRLPRHLLDRGGRSGGARRVRGQNLTKPAGITIIDEAKDDYQYEEVSADDEISLHEDDEDLSKALQTVQEQTEDAHILALQSVLTSQKPILETPQAIDDFFCNFLVRLGMSRTLDCFQTEWYELIERGVLTADAAGLVPDVYTRNQQLEAENLSLKKDLESYKDSANKTQEALLKMQRERDFHRMHHNRVVQEKNRLISDMKRLKAHYASYEPVLKQLSEKYQNSLTQKMLTSLERDKAMGQVTDLQVALESLESGYNKQIPETKVGHDCTRKKEFEGPTQKALREARQQKFLVVASSSCGPGEDAEKKKGRRNVK